MDTDQPPQQGGTDSIVEPTESAAMETEAAGDTEEGAVGGMPEKEPVPLESVSMPKEGAYLKNFSLRNMRGLPVEMWPDYWDKRPLVPGVVVRGASYAEGLKGWLNDGASRHFIQWSLEEEFAPELAIAPDKYDEVRSEWVDWIGSLLKQKMGMRPSLSTGTVLVKTADQR